jgi:hypothetical protein
LLAKLVKSARAVTIEPGVIRLSVFEAPEPSAAEYRMTVVKTYSDIGLNNRIGADTNCLVERPRLRR